MKEGIHYCFVFKDGLFENLAVISKCGGVSTEKHTFSYNIA